MLRARRLICPLQTHIITKNHRMTVSHVENRAWVLRIKDVKESDRGWWEKLHFLSHLGFIHSLSLCRFYTHRYMCKFWFYVDQWTFIDVWLIDFQVKLIQIPWRTRLDFWMSSVSAAFYHFHSKCKTELAFPSVPPDILDYPTSTDMVVREGSNVTLKCAARGSPTPNITWRREGSEPIAIHGGREGK